MKTLVVFDSNFGNTQKVADYAATLLGPDTVSMSVNTVKENDLVGLELLIVGSPINAWNSTKKTRGFLAGLNPSKMKGVKGAAFDTRIKSFMSGNAAKKIARSMSGAGVIMVAEPIGFFVQGNEAWVQAIKSGMTVHR
jgi:flavodoxin